MSRHITICADDQIADHADAARPFFAEVLALDWDACLVTDESLLSDFCSCGLPDGLVGDDCTLAELYTAWDRWILGVLRQRFNLYLPNTRIRMTALFEQLREAQTRPRVH